MTAFAWVWVDELIRNETMRKAITAEMIAKMMPGVSSFLSVVGGGPLAPVADVTGLPLIFT